MLRNRTIKFPYTSDQMQRRRRQQQICNGKNKRTNSQMQTQTGSRGGHFHRTVRMEHVQPTPPRDGARTRKKLEMIFRSDIRTTGTKLVGAKSPGARGRSAEYELPKRTCSRRHVCEKDPRGSPPGHTSGPLSPMPKQKVKKAIDGVLEEQVAEVTHQSIPLLADFGVVIQKGNRDCRCVRGVKADNRRQRNLFSLHQCLSKGVKRQPRASLRPRSSSTL